VVVDTIMKQISAESETDLLRRREFARLDETGTVYLDYTGAALYPASLIHTDASRLANTVFGNPHSESMPSLVSTDAIRRTREATLRFFDADPEIYDVVFTANASSAIRILAEAYPFRIGSRLVLTADNHNSVNGLRVQARRRGGTIEYVPLDRELRACDPSAFLKTASQASLFAFPAQSNFSGVQHPLEWIQQAQRHGYSVLLDAAAFVPTNSLSLVDAAADFVAISFYKMFGYPSGLGALIARRDALSKLRRTYFAGGTVQFVSVQNRMARRKAGVEAFEDGTPNFLAMPAVKDGLDWLDSLGMQRVQQRVKGLTGLLLERFAELDDRVEIYGPRHIAARGATIAFNLRRHGRILPFEDVESAARENSIAIRGGCFCNPGAAEHAFSIPAPQARTCLRGKFTIPRFRSCLGERTVGALRASIGIPTTVSDLDRLCDFVREITR
jgi:selenocysteine lyase/cysteine desulfurase